MRRAVELPAGVRDLAGGNPDPQLLPSLAKALASVDPEHKLYGGPNKLERLVELAESDFAADGVHGDVAIVGGALDGIERLLQAHVLPGDRVVVEDPSWPRIADLVHALGLQLEPVRVDERGLVPDELARALERGAGAVIATPRGQNPTGAAVDGIRGAELRDVLARYPEVLVVEDDYVAAVAGAPYEPLHAESERWAVIRSLSKVVGPDLRIALVAGDALTISRLEGRQLLGPGWVSHLLQQTAAQLLVERLDQEAAGTYGAHLRRAARSARRRPGGARNRGPWRLRARRVGPARRGGGDGATSARARLGREPG